MAVRAISRENRRSEPRSRDDGDQINQGVGDQPAPDAEWRQALIEDHLNLARHLAWRFANRGESLDDLVQVAYVGLCLAAERFDPDRQLEFKTFASPTIIGELKRHFRDKTWAVRVPRRLQELHLEGKTAAAEFCQEHGRMPTVAELATALGASEEDVLEAVEAGQSYRSRSIEAASGDADADVEVSWLAQHEGAFDEVEVWACLSRVIEQLSDRDRFVLYLRLARGEMQAEIAQRIGVSQMHVSRMLSSLRKRLAAAV